MSNEIRKKSRKLTKSIKWNSCKDEAVIEAFKTNQKNAWVTDRINVTNDRVSWTKLSQSEQEQFIKTFVILSKIDAGQGNIGMDILAENCGDEYEASVFRYEGGMEIVHSASYNKQLASFITTDIEDRYIDWADNSPEVANVVDFLLQSMIDLDDEEMESKERYLIQLAYSTILESFLFYLLFYYPFYQANVKNRMTKCAEVVRLILRDESVHGAFSAYLFRRDNAKVSVEAQDRIQARIEGFITDLYSRIGGLLDVVYETEEIREDIQKFANYNFNRTLRNLGFAEVFTGDDVDFHPAIKAEVDSKEVTFDIFSMTGNAYFMMNHEEFTDKHRKVIENAIKSRSKFAPKMRITV